MIVRKLDCHMLVNIQEVRGWSSAASSKAIILIIIIIIPFWFMLDLFSSPLYRGWVQSGSTSNCIMINL